MLEVLPFRWETKPCPLMSLNIHSRLRTGVLIPVSWHTPVIVCLFTFPFSFHLKFLLKLQKRTSTLLGQTEKKTNKKIYIFTKRSNLELYYEMKIYKNLYQDTVSISKRFGIKWTCRERILTRHSSSNIIQHTSSFWKVTLACQPQGSSVLLDVPT